MSETLFVQCAPGLERALAEELQGLGRWARCAVERGGVEVEGPPKAYEVVNLWSRLANRVLLRAATVASPDALRGVRLERFGAGFAVEVLGEGAGRWRAAAERAFGRHRDGVAVQVRSAGASATVSVDTSGELLYFRGYRQEIGRAPLRESLAAGVLHLGGFRPEAPLWDVMCGSGTFVIEGAEWAQGLAPGRRRRFAFESFLEHDAASFAARPRQRQMSHGRAPIFGSDLNSGALGTARRNAKRAGVFEALSLERLDATRLVRRPGVPPGLVVANLPYGRRVGEAGELGRLYRQLGVALKGACPGWRFALLLEDGVEALGLPVDGRFPVANGGLDCQVVVGVVSPPRAG